MIIPIDFVAGSHGNFLETVLNKYFNIVDTPDAFTTLGTSHYKSTYYQQNKLFSASHWFDKYRSEDFKKFDKIISIKFDQDDLLLLSSLSLLRSGDMRIENDYLEVDTRQKLKNQFYNHLLEQIDNAYPFLNPSESSIPRYVLREFFKFGFRNPDQHGFWLEQQRMQYHQDCCVFVFRFKSFYNQNQLQEQILDLEKFLNMKFDFSSDFYSQYQKFMRFIPYINHKQDCDNIIQCIQSSVDVPIPSLSLFQESYINAQLENIFLKEMPFHQDIYFTSTKDMLYYINNNAPNL